MAQGQTRESIKMALDTLRANKLRSGLRIPQFQRPAPATRRFNPSGWNRLAQLCVLIG
jgi:hypothetical protein